MKKGGVALGVTILVVVLIIVFGVSYYVINSSSTGTLILKITDAPPGVEITSVNVILSDIEVHQAKSTLNVSNESEDGKWFTIVEGPVTFDLIAIKDVQQLLGQKALSPGKYTQVRLNVDSATATIDGTEVTLEIPSNTVKIINEFDIVQDQTTTLILDFDALESINKQGNEAFKMTPVIKILEE